MIHLVFIYLMNHSDRYIWDPILLYSYALIPFKHQYKMNIKKKILSIQIRDISLEFDSYHLKIRPQNIDMIEVSQSKQTIV